MLKYIQVAMRMLKEKNSHAAARQMHIVVWWNCNT